MAPLIELPTIQNWSCHSCGGCCRQHEIIITDAEKARIESQGWEASGELPAGQSIFVPMGGWLSRKWWRLAHQPDGRCVFLDDAGLCRIHAKFGEPAKPLACRIYPYAFHPAGRKVTVSLRFSCPSVVRNAGRPVESQRKDIVEIARQVVPADISRLPPPLLKPGTSLSWNDLHAVGEGLVNTLSDTAAPVVVRLLRALTWTDLLEQATLDRITGPRLSELLDLLQSAAAAEFPADFDLTTVPAPDRLGRTQFRLIAGHYARKDTYAAGHGSLRGRLRLLMAALRLTLGRGNAPPLQTGFRPVPFARLEESCGPVSAEMDELFTRYFLVKLTGWHYCGRAYYDVPLIEGFRSLVLMFPSVLWLARWLAVSREHSQWSFEDVADALAIADHHHGYSPALGSFAARNRVRSLSKLGEISHLCAWLSRP